MYHQILMGLFREHIGVEADAHMVQLFMRLPYNRTQEYEADHIALVLLSKVRTWLDKLPALYRPAAYFGHVKVNGNHMAHDKTCISCAVRIEQACKIMLGVVDLYDLTCTILLRCKIYAGPLFIFESFWCSKHELKAKSLASTNPVLPS
jgi:hypothetical protein